MLAMVFLKRDGESRSLRYWAHVIVVRVPGGVRDDRVLQSDVMRQ